MRKQVLFILSLFLAINLHAENKFVIEGSVANVPDGLIVELLRNEDNVGMLVASDTLRNGKFRFEEETSGKLDVPDGKDGKLLQHDFVSLGTSGKFDKNLCRQSSCVYMER